MSFPPRFLKQRGITVIQKLDPRVSRMHPGKVGIVFIEPDEDDFAGFEMNPMSMWSTPSAVQHGYSRVRASLSAAHERLAQVFSGHGIELGLPPLQDVTAPAEEAVEWGEADLHESRGARAR